MALHRLILVLSCLAAAGSVSALEAPGVQGVQVHDSRLELSLFAEDPDIVTPIGLTVDANDRIFVIESHTHLPPRDYNGPKSDRIKVFVDRNDDGRADGFTVFADGIREAMNLALSPAGVLYVVCAREVFALHDRDGDGVSEGRERIVVLETTERYAHNSLLSMTFANDSWLYIGRGNVGGRKFTYRGSDGSVASGYGVGGDVVRCRPDGSRLEPFATGFWNPFDIGFAHEGRLLLVDNDPDARGPNRLVHVVPEGDYGYKSVYGGGGNHPFQGWDGSLPGTLPMVAATGEAPSGLLDGRRTALPSDLHDDVLVTIWNENTIDRFETEPAGASLTATSSVLVSGGDDFRPVAIDADTRGNVFFSDWVLVDYPNHGRGRIWRLSAKADVERSRPRARFAPYEKNPAVAVLEELRGLDDGREAERLLGQLANDDPFVRQAAVVGLSHPVFREQTLAATTHENARVRLGALLALQRAGLDQPESVVTRALRDSDLEVRRAALMWVGEETLVSLRDELSSAISGPGITSTLFETYLAAVQNLDPRFVEAYRGQTKSSSKSIKRRLDPELIRSIARDRQRAPALRVLAIRRLGADASDRKLLLELADAPEPSMQRQAIQKLAGVRHASAVGRLTRIAGDGSRAAELRAEAILSLSWHQLKDPSPILALADDPEPAVALEAIRALGSYTHKTDNADNSQVRDRLEEIYRSCRVDPSRRAIVEQIELTIGRTSVADGVTARRPESIEAWKATLARGGDPQSGRRVFYSPRANCSHCHAIDGLGRQLGPELTGVGRSLDRERIIHSILRPSDEFPPQYMAWTVITRDGQVHNGLQLDHKSGGAIEMFTTEAETVRFGAKEILRYEVSRRSLMPDGLEQVMTTSDLRDLVAFLESSTGSAGDTELPGGALAGERPRVLISSDIGGSDDDDLQSFVHYLVYADLFDTEGIVSSPPHGGRARDILKVIDLYEKDLPQLRAHSGRYPDPDELRAMTKQGAIVPAPEAGFGKPTDGSRHIIACARRDESRPLWVLVWGSITDVAQALHDAPEIESKIRVHFIASWNLRNDRSAANYIEKNHPKLWMIWDDSTFRGWYTGGEQGGDLGNKRFVAEHVKGHGALGDFMAPLKGGAIKMGDTPSVSYLLRGTPDDPTRSSWGGQYVKHPDRPNWYRDNPDPKLAVRDRPGARTVNRWRRDYLRDWQKRMDRCLKK